MEAKLCKGMSDCPRKGVKSGLTGEHWPKTGIEPKVLKLKMTQDINFGHVPERVRRNNMFFKVTKSILLTVTAFTSLFVLFGANSFVV